MSVIVTVVLTLLISKFKLQMEKILICLSMNKKDLIKELKHKAVNLSFYVADLTTTLWRRDSEDSFTEVLLLCPVSFSAFWFCITVLGASLQVNYGIVYKEDWMLVLQFFHSLGTWWTLSLALCSSRRKSQSWYIGNQIYNWFRSKRLLNPYSPVSSGDSENKTGTQIALIFGS